MEDSNPQETIADLYVGFLDRCVTITLIFRVAVPELHGRLAAYFGSRRSEPLFTGRGLYLRKEVIHAET